MEHIIRGNTEESAALRWVQKALGTDRHRSVLTNIQVTNHGATLASDSFRIHAIQTPDCLKENEGQLLSGKISAGNFTAVLTEDKISSFPDIQGVIPESKPILEAYLNPAFLIQALQGMAKDKAVYLRFFGNAADPEDNKKDASYEIIQPCTNRYALIMPMHYRESDDMWRPVKLTQEDSEKE